MLGNEHKLSWVSKHVGAKSNRPLLAALLIAVFFVLTRRRPDEDEGSGVVDTARDVRKVAEMVRRSKDSSRLLVGSYLSYQSALPYNRPTTQPRTHSPAHPLTRSPAHPLTRSPAQPLTRSPASLPLRSLPSGLGDRLSVESAGRQTTLASVSVLGALKRDVFLGESHLLVLVVGRSLEHDELGTCRRRDAFGSCVSLAAAVPSLYHLYRLYHLYHLYRLSSSIICSL